MSVVSSIIDAIVADLAVVGVSAARTYLPVHTIEDLAAGAVVTVVPRSTSIHSASRSQSEWECAVDIAVQAKIDGDDSVDIMLDFVQVIADVFRMRPLTGAGATFMRMDHDPVVAHGTLEEHRVLTSVLKITYRVRR